MISVKEIKHRLPEAFLDNLYEMFSPGTVDKIFAGIADKRQTTLRVNALKYNIQDLMKYFKEHNITFERVSWYKDALIIKNADEKDIEKLDIYKSGYIYLQSLSSMVPPLVLAPNGGERILDLTAAPGSKTTQIAALMNNRGYILANELNKLRCERLKFNIDSQGASIVNVINGRGEKTGEEHKGEFDRVLLDTPCSGEGRFLMCNVQTYRTWSPKVVSELVKMQKKLFASAYTALKTNGIMVYSTCTLNKEENEKILDWALKNFDMEIIDTGLKVKDAFSAFCDDTDKRISKAMRILPSKTMEGFFVSKLRKKG